MSKLGVIAAGVLAWAVTAAAAQVPPAATQEAGKVAGVRRPAAQLYAAQCASCHGADLNGGGASSLVDGQWEYGVGAAQVFRRIKFGIEEMGMPAYEPAMTDDEMRDIVEFITVQERQRGGDRKATPEVRETRDYKVRIETVVPEGRLKTPWGIAWMSPTSALITEKEGRLRVLEDGKLRAEPVADIPVSRPHGQGGLMAVAVDPEFAQSGWVYLGYTHELNGNFLTRIVRGKIVDNRWADEQVLFTGKPEHYSRAGVHFGTRIVFDRAGRLYFSIGDRGSQNQAQDITRPNGKVHRINRDGTIPADNPFVGKPNAYESIFSFGNRNPQGLAIHPETDALWATEHGPMGGDELNQIAAGKNYGWPVITYGKNYNGTIITTETHRDGMEQPATQWTPSLAVCGLDFYAGTRFPKWKNQLLVGALAFQEVRRVEVDGAGKVLGQEVILKNAGRVRDVRSGPDGAIWVLLNGPDKIVRLVPASE